MDPPRIQSREEKEQFFRELEALDQWTSDSENEERKALARRPLFEVSPNRSRSTTSSISHKAHALDVVPLFEQPATKPLANTISIPAKNDSKSEKQARGASTKSVPTASRKRKREKPRHNIEDIPEERQLFKGMVFYWVPNDDDCPVRRMRISKAISFGAVWTSTWREDVDHILVDDHLTMASVRARVTEEQLEKAKPLIVKTKWMSECISLRELRDEDTPRFQIPEPVPQPVAVPEPPTETPAPVGSGREPSYRTGFILKPLKQASVAETKPKEQPPQAIYKPINDADVAFERVIDEMRGLSALPLEVEPDECHFQSVENQPSKSSRKTPLVPSKPHLPDSSKYLNPDTFLCMHKNDGSKNNPNAHTLEILQQMSAYYERNNDQWRTLAYRKAASTLAKQTTFISTQEEAKKLPMIGQRLAEKIEEIATTNKLRRLEVVTADPDDKLMKLFTGIYQVGYKQARQWIMQGHRSLEDLKQKVKLSTNQRIGIDHYDDFSMRIPRAEVEKHAAVVERALKKADLGLQLIIGGSYRRQQLDSGDIDIIITKEKAGMSHIRDLVNNFVIPDLQEQNFLRAILTDSKESGSKLHGASTLSDSSVWRRIDFLYVPWDEFGAALIYFTGNDIFNRSLRLLASRKNMRLNQHGLYMDVMRGEGRKRITEGTKVAGHDEKEIFDILGVPYRPPEHRRC